MTWFPIFYFVGYSISQCIYVDGLNNGAATFGATPSTRRWFTKWKSNLLYNKTETERRKIGTMVGAPFRNRGIRWSIDVSVDPVDGWAIRLETRVCRRRWIRRDVPMIGDYHWPSQVNGLGNRAGRSDRASRPHCPARDWNPTWPLWPSTARQVLKTSKTKWKRK